MNDTWNHCSVHKGTTATQYHKGLMQGMYDCSLIKVDDSMIDMKAVYIAQQLMLANVNPHRQSAAASASALFHLAYHGVPKKGAAKTEGCGEDGGHCEDREGHREEREEQGEHRDDHEKGYKPAVKDATKAKKGTEKIKDVTQSERGYRTIEKKKPKIEEGEAKSETDAEKIEKDEKKTGGMVHLENVNRTIEKDKAMIEEDTATNEKDAESNEEAATCEPDDRKIEKDNATTEKSTAKTEIETEKDAKENVASDTDANNLRLEMLRGKMLLIHMDDCPLHTVVCECEQLVLQRLQAVLDSMKVPA